MNSKVNLTIEDVARWLDVNPRTVYRLLQSGEFPAFKVGNQWRVNQEMLKDWMMRRVIERKKYKKAHGTLS